MKKGLTLVVNIIDGSGSMDQRVPDVIGSVNENIKKYRELEGETRFSIYVFDHEIIKAVDYMDVKEIGEFTFRARGYTALHDAMGTIIEEIGEKLAKLPEDERPEQVQFMIITDGQENASKKFTAAMVKEKVEHQTSKYSWVFTYLGSNQDAILVGSTMGIDPALSATYNDGNMARTLNIASTKMRMSKGMDYTMTLNSMSYADSERASFVN